MECSCQLNAKNQIEVLCLKHRNVVLFNLNETEKRERNYQLLQAAAVMHAQFAGNVDDWTHSSAVNEAEALLAKIEQRGGK